MSATAAPPENAKTEVAAKEHGAGQRPNDPKRRTRNRQKATARGRPQGKVNMRIRQLLTDDPDIVLQDALTILVADHVIPANRTPQATKSFYKVRKKLRDKLTPTIPPSGPTAMKNRTKAAPHVVAPVPPAPAPGETAYTRAVRATVQEAARGADKDRGKGARGTAADPFASLIACRKLMWPDLSHSGAGLTATQIENVLTLVDQVGTTEGVRVTIQALSEIIPTPAAKPATVPANPVSEPFFARTTAPERVSPVPLASVVTAVPVSGGPGDGFDDDDDDDEQTTVTKPVAHQATTVA
jgi:hypothetical protein